MVVPVWALGSRSSAQSLRFPKCFFRRASFHHSAFPVIIHHKIFAPKAKFIHFGSFRLSLPFGLGWRTIFHFIRGNFFSLSFPHFHINLLRSLLRVLDKGLHWITMDSPLGQWSPSLLLCNLEGFEARLPSVPIPIYPNG